MFTDHPILLQLRQRIADGQFLRADGLALAAAHAVQGLFIVREAGGPLGLDGVLLAEHAQLVPDAEIVRDVHAHGAGHTVAAAGAANFDAAVQLVGHAFHGGILGRGEWFEPVKGRQVIGQLVLGAHAGEDDVHVLWPPTQRKAHEASVASGRRACSGAAASAGREASVPPLMGSMMTSGTPHSSVSW